MRIYHFTIVSLVVINGLLSIRGARLKCPSVSIANGSVKIRSKGRIAVYKCSRGFYLFGEPYAACIRGKWDSNPPVCIKPGCPPIKYFLNGDIHESWRSSLLRFTCDSGYKLVGPSYIYCNGRKWSSMQPYCKAVDIKCNFENKTTCNWEIDDYDDEDFNWRLQQHEPPSRILKTGPLHDHTQSPNNTGHYLVLETSDYTPSSRPARIHSPIFPQPSENNSCFIFWYHMYGNTIGTLNVFLNNVLAFQRRGNHGDRWVKGIISLNENVSSTELQIIIEGSYGGGYTGDIGLDDFTLGNGTECFASKVTSCVGRCYEDDEDTSFCLCNPECLTDSSCCKDFLDVCSIESTTPFFEPSTGVEDNTEMYSDIPETTVTDFPSYDTNYFKNNISTADPIVEQTILELETDSTSEHQYTTDSTTVEDDVYTSSNGVNNTQYNIKWDLHNNSDSYLLSSMATSYSNVDKEYKSYSDNTAIHQNSHTTSSYLEKERKTTEVNKRTSVANLTYFFLNPVSTDKSFFTTNNISQNIQYDRVTAIPTNQVFQQSKTDNSNHITTATHDINKSVTEPLSHSSISTMTNIPTGVSANSAFFRESSTFRKSTISNSETGGLNIGIHSQTTVIPITSTISVFKKLSFNTGFKTDNGIGKNISISPLDFTSFFPTSDLPNLTYNSVSTSNSFNSYRGNAHMSTNDFTSTIIPRLNTSKENIFKTITSTTPVFKNYTFFFRNNSKILPPFHNSTTLTTTTTLTTNQIYNTLDKLDDKVSNSHTHLQTTSEPPHIYSTPKESILVTSISSNMALSNHITVSSPKIWKSIYKPKEKFMFSAVLSDRSNGNQTFIALSVCAVVLAIVSTLLGIFYIKRRRFRLFDELGEADTNILYHSSQEMLDLHLARPNH